MMCYSRRHLLRGFAGVGAVSLAGCTGENSTPTDDEKTSTSGSNGDDDTINVGMVYATAGLDDKAFNDMAHRGVQQARLDYDISFDYKEPEMEEMATAQRDFAESTDPNYDLICCIGFDHAEGLKQNADEFPDQRFAIVDTVIEKENVASYTFEDQEGSFQMGYLAAQLTTKDFSAGTSSADSSEATVGFVGGAEIPPVKKFEAGYAAGVDYHDQNVEVLSEYVGDFGDIEGGKRVANRMYDEGADIIYHAAGGTGIGVFRAAQNHDRFALGVDTDQTRSNPRYSDVILASMTKRVDTAVYRSIKSIVNDGYQGGSVLPLGIAEKGIETVYGSEIGDEIPQAVKSNLEETRAEIVAGEITIPSEP